MARPAYTRSHRREHDLCLHLGKCRCGLLRRHPVRRISWQRPRWLRPAPRIVAQTIGNAATANCPVSRPRPGNDGRGRVRAQPVLPRLTYGTSRQQGGRTVLDEHPSTATITCGSSRTHRPSVHPADRPPSVRTFRCTPLSVRHRNRGQARPQSVPSPLQNPGHGRG